MFARQSKVDDCRSREFHSRSRIIVEILVGSESKNRMTMRKLYSVLPISLIYEVSREASMTRIFSSKKEKD